MDLAAHRGVLLLLPVLAIGAAALLKPQAPKQAAAASLATLWCLTSLMAVLELSRFCDWWHYPPASPSMLGMPVDLWLAWALLWGALPVLVWPSANLVWIAGGALCVDLLYMPRIPQAVVLHSSWLGGEAVSLGAVLIPAQLLARWTIRGHHTGARASMQCIIFSGLLLVLLPAALAQTFHRTLRAIPYWELALWCVPAAIGLSAVQEFVERGRGTPVPFDPPLRLVRTGIYSYVRNPMQLAITLLLPAVLIHSIGWMGLVGLLLALAYSQGLALWDEQVDLHERFGDDWTHYTQWLFRWLPRYRPAAPLAWLYVDADCGQCCQLGLAIANLKPVNLTILPATEDMVRITYIAQDGYQTTGVSAVARALEHVHFGWALPAMAVRLPVIRSMIQWINDAAGGGPREVCESDFAKMAVERGKL